MGHRRRSRRQLTAVYEPDGTAVSYRELAAAADQYGRGFQALGLVAGDTFATLLPNSSTALAMYFAAIETGLYVVPINWHQVGAEIGYILSDSDARVLVAHERFAAAATEAAGPGRGQAPVRGGRPCRASSRWPGSATTARTTARGIARTARRCCTRRAPPGGPRACAARSPGSTRTWRPPWPPGSSASSAWPRSMITCTCAGRRCTTPRCSTSRRTRSRSATRSC